MDAHPEPEEVAERESGLGSYGSGGDMSGGSAEDSSSSNFWSSSDCSGVLTSVVSMRASSLGTVPYCLYTVVCGGSHSLSFRQYFC